MSYNTINGSLYARIFGDPNQLSNNPTNKAIIMLDVKSISVVPQSIVLSNLISQYPAVATCTLDNTVHYVKARKITWGFSQASMLIEGIGTWSPSGQPGQCTIISVDFKNYDNPPASGLPIDVKLIQTTVEIV